MTEERGGDRGRLLGDLFEHEVLVAALLGCREVPVDVKRTGVGGSVIAVEVSDPIAVGGDHHGLILPEFNGFAGVGDERRDIGAEEHLALADPDDQWRGPSRGDDGAGIVGMSEHQGELTLQSPQHR